MLSGLKFIPRDKIEQVRVLLLFSSIFVASITYLYVGLFILEEV